MPNRSAPCSHHVDMPAPDFIGLGHGTRQSSSNGALVMSRAAYPQSCGAAQAQPHPRELETIELPAYSVTSTSELSSPYSFSSTEGLCRSCDQRPSITRR